MNAATRTSGTVAGRRVPTLRLSLVVAAVIVALALIDVSLRRTEQNEIGTQALQADRNGHQLLQQGRADEAVDAFRKAHALERENTNYEIDLIEALMAAGKFAEAQPLMREILEEQSNDGEANLVAARLAAKQGQINTADSYYHRAIYGAWPDNLTQHQMSVRLELIDYLAANGEENELLAELLPLQEQARNNTRLQPRLAKLFLTAGSAARARDVYRQLIKLDPTSGANYAGLGEAELALGDFRAAHAAFSAAVARQENDAALRERLDLAKLLSDIDPTPRGLSTQEKYSRSMRILQLASSDLQQCITNHPELATDDATQLVAQAKAQLAAAAPKQPTNEIAEGALSLSETIWRVRVSLCGTGTAPDEEPLPLIMAKLTG
ncbi:MAG TPA: tetratricopeptide repeat protein [Bryobacteraceae bacterium]|nr:tetratricopeptide repeat protein [Bryobacteraceae bacterium]